MWGEIFNLQNPLIGADNSWALWSVCVLGAAVAIGLEQRYAWAAKLTGAILALIFALVLSNLGIIPMDAPTWDIVWGYVVPLAIPLLLFRCDIQKIGKESGRLLVLFLIGSMGTSAGAVAGYLIFKDVIPELSGLAGVFTGTYIGGTVNFVALSDAFTVSQNMISAATVADNLLMAGYFFVLLAIPSMVFFQKHFAHPYLDEQQQERKKHEEGKTAAASYWERKKISLWDIAANMAAAFLIVTISGIGAAFVSDRIPADSGAFISIFRALLGNKYLWITTISMVGATAAPGFFGKLSGSEELGTFMIYIFFFVIGVPASVVLILKNSPLLLLFAAFVVFVNMLFSFFFGKLFKFSLEEIILTSNANIGGPTTAAAMAVSKGWTKLVGPIMLIGTFGYVVGTYFGLFVGSLLGN